MSNTTTFTAYLPRHRSVARELETRYHGELINTSFQLDSYGIRLNRQSRNLDHLNYVYLNNIDSCDKYYKSAHVRDLELGHHLTEVKDYFSNRKTNYKKYK